MRPVLFHVGPVAVPTHETFVMLGVLAALVVTLLGARGRLDERLRWVVVGPCPAGRPPPRWATCCGRSSRSHRSSHWSTWRHGGAQHPRRSGRCLCRGRARQASGGLPPADRRPVRSRRGPGQAVGRIGCFLTEQVGTPTSLPWAISVEAATAARIPICPACAPGVPMHPSFLYEIAFHAVAFWLLLRMRDRPHPDGELLTGYLLAYGVFRFAVEFVRGNQVVWGGLTGPQLFLLVTVPVVATALRLRWRRWMRPRAERLT